MRLTESVDEVQAMTEATRAERSLAAGQPRTWPTPRYCGTLQAMSGDYLGTIRTLAPELDVGATITRCDGARSPTMRGSDN